MSKKKFSLYDAALDIVKNGLNFEGIDQQSKECNEFATGWMESNKKIALSHPFIEREFQDLWAKHSQVDLVAVQCNTCAGYGYLQSNYFPVGNRTGRVLMNLKLAVICCDCHGNGVPLDLFEHALKFKFKVIAERGNDNGQASEKTG